MKKKRKRASGTVKLNDQVIGEFDLPIEVTDPGEPCSHVRIGCGWKKSAGYNSVHVDAEVEVPVKVGEERIGAEYAVKMCSAIVDDLTKPALEALKAL